LVKVFDDFFVAFSW